MKPRRLFVASIVLGSALLAPSLSIALRPADPPRRGADPAPHVDEWTPPPRLPDRSPAESAPGAEGASPRPPTPPGPHPSPAQIVRSLDDWEISKARFQGLFWGGETALVNAVEDLLGTLSETEFEEGLAEWIVQPTTVHAPLPFGHPSLLRLASLLEAQSSQARRRFVASVLCAASLGKPPTGSDAAARSEFERVLAKELAGERDLLVATKLRVLLWILAPGGRDPAELVSEVGEALSRPVPGGTDASGLPEVDPRELTLCFLSQHARAGVDVCLEVLGGLVRHPDESVSRIAWMACASNYLEGSTGPAERELFLRAIDSWTPKAADDEGLYVRLAREAAWFHSDRDIGTDNSAIRAFLFGDSRFLRCAAVCFAGNHPDLLRTEEWERVRRAAGPGEPAWLAAMAREALEEKTRWEAGIEGLQDPFAPSREAAYPVPR